MDRRFGAAVQLSGPSLSLRHLFRQDSLPVGVIGDYIVPCKDSEEQYVSEGVLRMLLYQ